MADALTVTVTMPGAKLFDALKVALESHRPMLRAGEELEVCVACRKLYPCPAQKAAAQLVQSARVD